LTTTRANAQLVCWFTLISPHRPALGTPEVAACRRFGRGGALVVLVAAVGATAAGELVESLEVCFEPPAVALTMISATAATTTPSNAGTIHLTAFLMLRPASYFTKPPQM
jgi:hypothetical protein